MTGPEHFQQAARLVGEAGEHFAAPTATAEGAQFLLACAQVHATLALAAAQAAVSMESYIELDEMAAAWAEALR